LLAGCAKPGQQAVAPPGEEGKVGYVDIDALVRVHPLYAQLAQTERSIDALNLRSLGPNVAQTGSNLSKEDAELQQELAAASDRTRKILDQKQVEYQREENAAITAALAAGGQAVGGGKVGANVGATAGRQVAGVNGEMNRDVQAYRNTLSAQERDQAYSYQKAVAQRVDRQYQAKANELQTKEAELELSLQTKDAPTRLELHTRLANLALDQATRDQVKAQLDALDKAEADQVAAMRNRDQQTLAQLRAQLRTQAQHDVQSGVAKIQSQTASKLTQAPASSPGAVPPGVVASANLPPDLKAKIDALHKEYQGRFSRDAKSTIDQFNKTRDDLSRRYAELHSVDAGASASFRKELAALQAQHDQLYAEIVDQINREVRLVAQAKGVTTVLSDVVANGNGIDLTDAAKKEIESLHE
jgi:hypothetical protein